LGRWFPVRGLISSLTSVPGDNHLRVGRVTHPALSEFSNEENEGFFIFQINNKIKIKQTTQNQKSQLDRDSYLIGA
jgi:hypothetical protein